MKMLIYAIMFLLCLGIGYVIVFITSNLPGMHGVIHVNRSSGNGTIYRLLDGIPHVHADSIDMGYYTLGFAMSTDRVFHMDKMRRLAQGRLSELFGEAALNVDKAMRNLGFEYLAKMIYMHMDEESKQHLKDFADGVNDYPKYFSEGIDYWLLGTEFEKWKPEDSLSIYSFIVFSLTHSDEIFREYLFSKLGDEELVDRVISYFPDHEVDFSTPVFTDEELKEFGFYKKEGIKFEYSNKNRKVYEFLENNIKEELKLIKDIRNLYSAGPGASNCWAVSGKHTKSGKPILVNDPHLDPSIPSPFYLAEMNINDNYLIGALLPGVPIFVSGRSNNFAFGVTSLNADIIDFFEEKIDGKKYQTRGKWEEIMTREEVIQIKDGEPVSITIRSTHHGPILDYVGAIMNSIDLNFPPIKVKAPIAMSWGGYQFENHAIHTYLHAFEIQSVKQALNMTLGKHGMAYGVCMADSSGNIAYAPMASFPNRTDHVASARGIKEGWTGNYDWKGFVNIDKIPVMLNPKKGYVFTANGRVSSQHVEAGIGVTQAGTARATRINQLLNEMIHVQGKKVDISDMKRILNDTYDVYAAVKIPLMIKIVDNEALLKKYIKDETALATIKGWIKDLKSWDYIFSKDAKEPTIFTLWEYYVYDNIFKNQIPDEKIRLHSSMVYGYEDFIIDIYTNLIKDPTYFSNY
jgi:penicillin G amidase